MQLWGDAGTASSHGQGKGLRDYEAEFKVRQVEEALVGVAHIAAGPYLGGTVTHALCGVLFDVRTEAVSTAPPGAPLCGLCEDVRRRQRGE